MDFSISYKILKNDLIDDLRAMQTQQELWADFSNKHLRTGEYEKIQDEFENIANPSKVKTFPDLTLGRKEIN